jgi:hypothetical protein
MFFVISSIGCSVDILEGVAIDLENGNGKCSAFYAEYF